MSKRLLAVVALAAAVVGVSGCIVVPAYPGGYGGGYRHGHGFGQDAYGRGGPPQGITAIAAIVLRADGRRRAGVGVR
jgi:hypothetical protein